MHYQWDFPFLLRYAPLFWKGVRSHAGLHGRNDLPWPDPWAADRSGPTGARRPDRAGPIPVHRWPVSPAFWLYPLQWCLIAFVEVFRCTPLLVQIVWVYYALPVLARRADPRDGRRDPDVVVLHGRVLRGDLSRRHHVDRARPMGRGARAWACVPGP